MHLYQQPISQANAVGFIRSSTITHALISTINDHFQVQDLLWIPRHILAQHLLPIHLYADWEGKFIITIFQVSFLAVSSNPTTPYNTRDHSLLCSLVPQECLLLCAFY